MAPPGDTGDVAGTATNRVRLVSWRVGRSRRRCMHRKLQEAKAENGRRKQRPPGGGSRPGCAQAAPLTVMAAVTCSCSGIIRNLTQRVPLGGEVTGGHERVRVILAQDPATASENVLVQVPRRLMLAQRAQVDGEVTGGLECVRVVLAQDPAEPGESVLI